MSEMIETKKMFNKDEFDPIASQFPNQTIQQNTQLQKSWQDAHAIFLLWIVLEK